MTVLTFYPANTGTPIIFTEDDEDAEYRLTYNRTGFATMPVSHKTVVAPGQHGATCYFSAGQPRVMTFDVAIQASTIAGLKTLITRLATALNPLIGDGVLQCVTDDGNTYNISCRGNGGPTLSTSEIGPDTQIATVILIAHDPLFSSGSPHQLTIGAAGVALFPFSFPFTIGGSATTKTATNAGSHEAPVTITINGPVVNPVITRKAMENGEEVTRTLSLTLTIASGDKVVITTGKGNQAATYTASGVEYLGEPYVDLDSEYWTLEPGINTITFSKTSGGTALNSFVMEWSDKYVGVGV